MDINLDTLKSEILEHLETSGFTVFHGSTSEYYDKAPEVDWDSERYPDYRMYLETARRVGVQLIVFGSREFEASELDDLLEELSETDLPREERREYERRIRDLRVFVGATCSIEIAFSYQGSMYVYHVSPDWFDEYMNVADEISAEVESENGEDDESLGGYYSNN